ncbi:M20/M25/M40 family metallo-hydrolase [Bradyrhizobium sp. RT11b]|uniref:M20 family metallopeptidase n=1 Tax=Bradyrhizobium sp. RT11b TaxID=3156332 RepID=UPI003393F018
MTLDKLIDADFVLATLRGLLSFDTQNPPGNEEPAVLFLQQQLASVGVHSTYMQTGANRGNLLAVLKGTEPGPNILFNGHIDTQPVAEGWSTSPFGARIADGKIYGCGSGDMKSGVAAMAGALHAASRHKGPRRGDLVMLAVADEVSGGRYGTEAALDKLRPLNLDCAIVGEPTLGDLVIGHRGVVWIKLQVLGRPGQANKPGAGVNAIAVMAEMLTALESHASKIYPSCEHPWLLPPNLNIGRIEGGRKENTVAVRCAAYLDRRLLLEDTPESVINEFHDVVRPIADARGAVVSLEPTMHVPAALISEDTPIVGACRQAFERITGRTPKVRTTGGFTDMHFFVHKLGIPALNFGPWYLTPHPSGSWTDIPDECAHVDEIVTGTKIYARIVDDLQCATQ